MSTPQLNTYSVNEATDYQFSGRHNGLYLFFGRILRPLWFSPLAREIGKSQLMDCVVTSDELISGNFRYFVFNKVLNCSPDYIFVLVLTQLNALKGFVHANVHQTGALSGPSNEKGRLQVSHS